MSSAAAYTNRVKVIAQAKNTKVDYPGHVAKNSDTLKATLGCSPNYTIQNYVITNMCKKCILRIKSN
jgi:hypothetical protein